MKVVYLFGAILAVAALAGCNHPNNGEQPPTSELPKPYNTVSPATHAASSATASKPVASSGASTTAGASAPSSASTPASAPKTAASKPTSVSYTFDAAKGKATYATNCSVCHKANGEGTPGVFPPLKGNAAVTDPDPTLQIQTVLHGVHGKTIGGTKYSGVMPPYNWLSDTQIANTVNYERSSWGNHSKHVTLAEIKAARAGGTAAK